MRKALISLVIVALMLTFPIAPTENMTNPYSASSYNLDKPQEGPTSLASASGTGNSTPAVHYRMPQLCTREG